MEILKKTAAGTMESSDAIISVEPGRGSLDIKIESIVLKQFGEEIRKTVEDVCSAMGVKSCIIHVKDRGAIDSTIRARTETAIIRAGGSGK